jgi:hypothetical protein
MEYRCYRNTLAFSLDEIRVEDNRSSRVQLMPVTLHSFLVQGQEEVHVLTAGPDACLCPADHRKIVSPADQGGIVEIQVDMIAHAAKEPGNHCPGTVDPIPGLATNQHRYVVHTGSPYVLMLSGEVYKLA